jgi:CRP/FNR family transcriptional regulator
VHATHEQIAVELGSAREVVSRLLKEFERMGAVVLHRGRIDLADAALLKGVAQGG